MGSYKTFIEYGKKKTFVGAIDWPGWCRWGRNENEATEAFLAYGIRYRKVIENTSLSFEIPRNENELSVVERHEGDVTTDFGAPSILLDYDKLPMGREEYRESEAILTACWKFLDETIERATGKELRKGPRGGGRDLEKIIEHVLAADDQYLRKLAWKHKREKQNSQHEELMRMRQGVFGALEVAERGELPEKGPRGGTIWSPRFFVRRVAWHTLDHAWEIEDRIVNE